MRHSAYPKFIERGRMTQAIADKEILAMTQILAVLNTINSDKALQSQLIGRGLEP